MVGVLSTLCRYLGDFRWSPKVHLEPLVVIVVSCAPGSHVRSSLGSAQSSQPRGVILVERRRGSDHVVSNRAFLHSKRLVAAGN